VACLLLHRFGTLQETRLLLDATLIRALLVPAVIALVGRWNWWLPDWSARLLRVEPSPPRRTDAAEAEA
jgi:putative drug exporter of the RND superfamily